MRVTETIGPAWETMKRTLFRPAKIGTWFSFGVIFALQSCVEDGGSGGNYNPSNFGGGSGGSSGSDTSDAVSHVLPNVLSAARGDLGGIGASEVALLAVVAVIVVVPLLCLLFWLGSRGQMMAIRAVATERGDVGEAWNATKTAGGRMFKFHLVVAGIALAVFLPIVGAGAAVAVPALRRHDSFDTLLPIIVVFAIVACLAILPFAIVGSLGRNFVAPIMLKHEVGAREGWKRFWAIGRNHIGSLFAFWGIGFAFTVVATIAGFVGSILTCCCGFFPIIHQTILAPYYVFERAWTLEILASMSPDFDLRQPPQGGFVPPGGFGYLPPGQSGLPGYGPPPGGYGGPPAGGFGGPPAGGYGPSGYGSY